MFTEFRKFPHFRILSTLSTLSCTIFLGKFLCSPIGYIKEILKDHSVSQDVRKSNVDDIKGCDGDVVVGDFIYRIHLHDSFDVVWKKGTVSGKCVAWAYDEEGLPDNSLSVSNRGGYVDICSRTAKLVVVVSPSLESVVMSKFASGNVNIGKGLHTDKLSIEIAGSGCVNCDDVEVEKEVSVEIKGSGSVVISGCAHSAHLCVDGSGTIDTQHLKANSVYAHINGSGDILCNPQKELDGAVYGSGCIRYKGNPIMSVGGTNVIRIP